MKYKSSLDTISKVVTIFSILLFLFLIYNGSLHYSAARDMSILIIIFGAIFFISYAFNSSEYLIENRILIIQRPLQSIKIPLSEITSADRLEKTGVLDFLRVFGIGGLL